MYTTCVCPTVIESWFDLGLTANGRWTLAGSWEMVKTIGDLYTMPS